MFEEINYFLVGFTVYLSLILDATCFLFIRLIFLLHIVSTFPYSLHPSPPYFTPTRLSYFLTCFMVDLRGSAGVRLIQELWLIPGHVPQVVLLLHLVNPHLSQLSFNFTSLRMTSSLFLFLNDQSFSFFVSVLGSSFFPVLNLSHVFLPFLLCIMC